MLAVIASVARRYALVLTKSDLDHWKRDLKVLTKIYRDIDLPLEDSVSPETKRGIEQVQKAFTVFKDNFTQWVYKTVIPKPSEKGGEAPMERDIMKSTWNFKHTLGASFLFPSFNSGTFNVSEIKGSREKAIKRYQVAATKAFKDLEDYIEIRSERGPVVRREEIEHFEVSGVPVIVENWGRSEMELVESELHKCLNQLKKYLDRIKGAGFESALRGLTFTISFDTKGEALTAGRYTPSTDTLQLYPIGLIGDSGAGTLTHEIGHRFYYKSLPNNAVAHWEETMNARGVKITSEDISRFVRAITKGYNSDYPWELADKQYRLQWVLPLADSEEEEAKFKELCNLGTPDYAVGADFDVRNYEDKLLYNFEGQVVQLEEITEYANSSPTEAFAECFREYVLKGPRALGPWTLNFFKEVCRAGGAKLASGQDLDPITGQSQ